MTSTRIKTNSAASRPYWKRGIFVRKTGRKGGRKNGGTTLNIPSFVISVTDNNDNDNSCRYLLYNRSVTTVYWLMFNCFNLLMFTNWYVYLCLLSKLNLLLYQVRRSSRCSKLFAIVFQPPGKHSRLIFSNRVIPRFSEQSGHIM